MSSLRKRITPILSQVPLRQVLVIPFVLQIFAVVGLVGYLSYRSGQQAVTDLANQLMEETSDRVKDNLGSYFALIASVNHNNGTILQKNLIDIYDLPKIQNYFVEQNKIFPTLSTVALANEEGDFLSVEQQRPDTLVIRKLDASQDPGFYRYFANENGENLELQEIRNDYDPHNDPPGNPWYKATRKARQGNWSLVVSLSKGKNQPEIHIAHMLPLYDAQEQFQGVSVVTSALIETGQFLASLNVGTKGQVFLIEPNGLLIATSTEEVPFEPQPRNELAENVDVQHRRLSATQSQNEITRATTEYLLNTKHLLTNTTQSQAFEFRFKSERYLAQVMPLQGKLNWRIVTVVPESDFMAEISANTRITIFLCLVALLVAIILGVLTARWITQPILKLNQAAKSLREGQWEQEAEVDSSRQDELGELAQSFSTMATQLQAAFKTLEQRVAERTFELTESNRQLAVAKEKAEVANQAKSAFIANMSHELRTPLNAILGFSQLLTSSPELTSEHRDSIRIINQNGEHLLSLINNVLDLSKIEAGKTTLNPQNFDLWNLLDQTVDMFRLRAENQGLQLRLEREPNVPHCLYTDFLKLRQVLINLLNNALKFTTEGSVTLRVTTKLSIVNGQWSFVNGHLSFVNGHSSFVNSHLSLANNHVSSVNNQVKDQQATTKDKRPTSNNKGQMTKDKRQMTIQFEVEDTGSGIATEDLDQLFQAFSQTQTGKDTQEGTGLGLAISRQFVQLMGGEIKVKSQVGVGSSFIFDIQALLGDITKIAPNQPTCKIIALAPNQPYYKILVVDDKATNRQLLIKLLNPLGFLLREATNGEKAIAIWQEWEPDLIFMDMQMPVMDGYQATRQIKRGTQAHSTVVIALTASVLEEEKSIVLSAGCDDFVGKPFRGSVIFDMLTKHLGVQYICEATHETLVKAPSYDLKATELKLMPTDWLTQLYQASTALNEELILSLLQPIRERYPPLATALTDLVHQYRFDKIKKLIEECNGELRIEN
ncbi:MAG: response regulator [Symploca sp. SIO3E6]|nr:response regulator [Caldora sp. SIO3E6]